MRVPKDSSFSSSGVVRSRGLWMSAERWPRLRPGPRRDDHRAPLTAHEGGPEKEHRDAVAERRVGGYRGQSVLLDGHALPVSAPSSTRRLMVCSSRASAGIASPASSLEDVARHEVGRGEDLDRVAPPHPGVGRLHLLERRERGLGAALLHEAEGTAFSATMSRIAVASPNRTRVVSSTRLIPSDQRDDCRREERVSTMGFANCWSTWTMALLPLGLGSLQVGGPSCASRFSASASVSPCAGSVARPRRVGRRALRVCTSVARRPSGCATSRHPRGRGFVRGPGRGPPPHRWYHDALVESRARLWAVLSKDSL